MHSKKIIHVISCHAEGEVGDVIVGGVRPPPGETLWEQSRFIAKDQALRNFMLNEPRGGVFRHINLLVPPKHPDADAAWIIMEPEDTPPMSGSNSICVSMVLVDSGIIPMREPITSLILEAPGGLVQAEVHCEQGRVKHVKIINVPSFVDKLDQKIEVEGVGTLMVDTAYGGDTFVLVNAKDLGFEIVPNEAKDLAMIGQKITNAANQQLGFSHPLNPDWAHISFCQFTLPIERQGNKLVGKNTVSIKPGKLDRSPCGTGCSARLAVMKARKEIDQGERFIGRSIIDSEFHCQIESVTQLAGISAIIPSISGRAWITGTHQHTLDPEDPWPTGYRLTDTWPKVTNTEN